MNGWKSFYPLKKGRTKKAEAKNILLIRCLQGIRNSKCRKCKTVVIWNGYPYCGAPFDRTNRYIRSKTRGDIYQWIEALQPYSIQLDADKLSDKTASSLGKRGCWLINESGLYSLVLSRKLVSAEQLQYMVMRMTNLITICYRICRLVS